MKRVDHAHMTVVALSDEGRRGKNNEDRYGVSAYRRKDRKSTPVLLAVLADGIGGHRAGEVAADMAVNLISSHVAGANEMTSPTTVLQEAIQLASQAIYKHAAATPGREGMGATCAIAYVMGNRLIAANVGDSRIYLLRGGQLRQLSTDHTWIQEALDHGLLMPEQVRGHPNAHVIRRFLGSQQPPEPAFCLTLNGAQSETDLDEGGIALQGEDILVLCSDGLTDLVSDEEISAALAAQPIEAAANGLIELANQRGGHDNITLILLQTPNAPAKKNGRARRFWVTSCLSAFALVVLAAAGLLGYNLFFRQETATPTPQTALTLRPLETSISSGLATRQATPVPLESVLPDQQPESTARTLIAPIPAATITPWPTFTNAP